MGFNLQQLENLSQSRSVAWHIAPFLNDPNTKAQAERILKQGYESEVVKLLKSMTHGGMLCGLRTKVQRLAEARRFAVLAEMSVEEIAQEHGLEDVLKETK